MAFFCFGDWADRIHQAGFEKVVASLFAKPNVDIYISGNKAQLLGGKDATLLSGRYVEIHMEP